MYLNRNFFFFVCIEQPPKLPIWDLIDIRYKYSLSPWVEHMTVFIPENCIVPTRILLVAGKSQFFIKVIIIISIHSMPNVGVIDKQKRSKSKFKNLLIFRRIDTTPATSSISCDVN